MSALWLLAILLTPPPAPGVEAVLDDFHRAASAADGARYFGHFSEDATFVGTDAKEVWSVAAFKAYADPFFSKGKGWTYHPEAKSRVVGYGPDRRTAWFYETLNHDKYGVLRGSGALVQVKGVWKITQYVLSFAVPNDLAGDVVRRIKDASGR